MVNKTNMRKVVAALRSGDYKQGQRRLAIVKPDGSVTYCCLGVFCEVAIADGLGVRVGERHDSMGQEVKEFDDEYLVLPVSVRDWLGVNDTDPEVAFGAEFFRMSSLNDDVYLSFREIAGAIEDHYKLLEDGDTDD
jgi:hypothetical protein